jgi:hypothetical protein
MKETELAKKFIDYLSDSDLWFEVDYFRSVDIVAIHNKITSAYEVKLSFNFKVLEQALENKLHFNYSYICTTKCDSIQVRLCEDYGLGLLIYNTKGYSDIREYVRPKLNRHVDYKLLVSRLHERNKLSIAGSKTGDCGKITAFQVTVENAVRHVSRNPGCTLKEMISGISHHYYSDERARASLYQWIRTGVIKEIKLDNGKLYANKTD